MGDFKTDLKKRDLLFSAFHERKNYRDNWISKIEAELEDQTLDGKAINKKMIGIEKWKNLHPVIERYSESVEEWGKFYFAELWKIVTGDRELADVVYNGILHLKGRIVQNREAEGLPILCADMSKLAYGRDSKDYQEWALLNELKDGLHEAFRQDQQQTSTAADQQGAEQGEGAPIEKRNSIIEQLVRDHKKYSDWDFLVFEAIDSMNGTTQEKRVIQFCSLYGAPETIISPYKNYQSRDFSEGKIRQRRTKKKKV